LDDLTSFQRIFGFFQEVCLGGISLTNRHLLLDGHNSHAALEAIEQAHAFGLNMVTLPAHTFHALQPFDVSCFKPFKKIFKKEKDVAMSKNITWSLIR
jgi:hypothetical protein